MVAPMLWITSDEGGAITGHRFVATRWDKSLPGLAAAKKAALPGAWQQLGQQAIYPD
jgi:hypothetical protein